MRQYSDEELIIIGRFHALRSAREECMSDINRNHFSMSGTDVTCKGEAGRMLELLESQAGLVQAFQDIEPEYQSALNIYRETISGDTDNTD